jgi:hypothetical protein
MAREALNPPAFVKPSLRPLSAALLLLLIVVPGTRGAEPVPTASAAPSTDSALPAFKSALLTATTRHLNILVGADGSARAFKGKTAQGETAFAFYLLFELTGNPTYRKVAVALADRVLQDMRAAKFGVLPIKEKEKSGGEIITGGGPPALGFYASRTAYILHREGGRSEDLHYLARVLDQYPWNENGWWASTIDVKTGESKEPMSKPSIINKTASIAMAAGILSGYIRNTAPELSARLKHKTDRCVYQQIIPAQEADGFWHYSLSGNDPKDKDVLGYFMLTTNVLMDLQRFNDAYRDEKLSAAVQRAQAFALRCIAPMTAPNQGPGCRERATPGTPARYTLPDDTKRSFALGRVLLGGERIDEGIRIMNAALPHFPYGNVGQDGAHAAEPAATILVSLR